MELRDYQRHGVDFLQREGRAVLADEMGAGKTPQLIRAAEGLTLVVAPPPLHRNWEREIAAWRPGSNMGDVVVTSYHSLVDSSVKNGHGHVLGAIKERWRGPWDTVIFDEAHHMKGRNTGYAKAAVKLANQTERAYLATGTPVRNWAYEVFMLCRAMYPADPRFSSFWRWADRWFTISTQTHRRKGSGKKIEHRVVGDLRDITTWDAFARENGLTGRWLRRQLDDPEVDIELPPVQRVHVDCMMGRHQRNVYRSMERSFFAEWNGVTTIATSSGSQWASLMRLSSGVPFHPDFEADKYVASSKLEVLADLVQGNRGPFIVFTWYQRSAEVLADWFRHHGYTAATAHGGMSNANRDQAVEEHQAGAVEVLVGTYGSISEGLNMTHCNKVVLFETPAVPALVDQAIGRIRRYGQTEHCTVWTLASVGTVDEFFVKEVLPAKRTQSEAVIQAADLREWLDGRSFT